MLENGEKYKENTEEKYVFKDFLRQIFASLIAALSTTLSGNSIAFTAILLPQLNQPDSEITLTKEQSSWIASIISLMGPVGSLSSSYVVYKIGKLNTLKIAAIASTVGWVIIALSTNFTTLMIGRTIIGFTIGLQLSPSMVYIAEISHKDIRGSLLSLSMCFGVTGLTVTYLKGWLLNWRTIAWTSNIYTIIHLAGLFVIPESPIWLISKKNASKAVEAFMWLQPNKGENFAKAQLRDLIAQNEKMNLNKRKENKFLNFLKPTGYKPLLIMTVLYFIQQFSGIFIFLYYSVSFLEAVGTTVNPYIASVVIGAIRLVVTLLTIWLSKIFTRRLLIISTTFSAGICIFISGLFSLWIKNGSSDKTWVPVLFIILYTISATIGPLTITFGISAELFPNAIRDIASSLTCCILNIAMFLAVHSYTHLLDLCGGIAGIQFLFAAVATAGGIFEVMFLPETHRKSLAEIEDYFIHNTLYLFKTKSSDRTPPEIQLEQNSLLCNSK